MTGNFKLYNTESIQNIANAIRAKNGSQETYKLNEMAQAIQEISTNNDIFEDRIKGSACEYSNNNVTVIDNNYIIANWRQLQKLSLPNVKHLYYAITFGPNGNSNLEINLKGLESIEIRSLQLLSCKNLVLPNLNGEIPLEGISDGTIPIIDLGPRVNSISIKGLTSCKNTLILRRSQSIVTLGRTDAFYSAVWGSSGTGGKLYVPQTLISSYQEADNWSTLLSYSNNQILAIEGSEYENYYADGSLIPTQL